MSKKSIILLIATILLGIVIVKMTDKAEEFSSQELNELNDELMPYKVKKNDLETEIRNLEDDYNKVVNGKGNLIIMFIELSDKFYSKMKTELTDETMTGVMILSKEQFPGEEGCISMDEFNNLLSLGWKYYVTWEKEETPEQWLEYWSDRLESVGLAMPDVVHFDKNVYNEEYNIFLTENGIQAVIKQGVTGQIDIVTGCETDPWVICAVGWNEIDAKNLMERAVTDGGTLAFTVGMKGTGEEYIEDDFKIMIDTLSGYIKRDSIQITDVMGAREYEATVTMELIEERQEIENQIQALETEIESVEAEIEDIYDAHKK